MLEDRGHVPTSGDGEGWQRIKPDSNYDWINQSGPTRQHLMPLGDKTTRQAALRGSAGSGADSPTVFHI